MGRGKTGGWGFKPLLPKRPGPGHLATPRRVPRGRGSASHKLQPGQEGAPAQYLYRLASGMPRIVSPAPGQGKWPRSAQQMLLSGLTVRPRLPCVEGR